MKFKHGIQASASIVVSVVAMCFVGLTGLLLAIFWITGSSSLSNIVCEIFFGVSILVCVVAVAAGYLSDKLNP